VQYLVELERPYGGDTFDEELMTRIAERAADHADDIATQLSHPFEVQTGRLVRDRLGEIRAPTVVVHGTADPMFPLAHGRALAAAIPGARLLALDGFGHATVPRRFWPELLAALPAPSPPAGA
jgi:pimeloyl-ACP methyl ester carboxylesterase